MKNPWEIPHLRKRLLRLIHNFLSVIKTFRLLKCHLFLVKQQWMMLKKQEFRWVGGFRGFLKLGYPQIILNHPHFVYFVWSSITIQLSFGFSMVFPQGPIGTSLPVPILAWRRFHGMLRWFSNGESRDLRPHLVGLSRVILKKNAQKTRFRFMEVHSDILNSSLWMVKKLNTIIICCLIFSVKVVSSCDRKLVGLIPAVLAAFWTALSPWVS
jgi:hypothetical protein